MIDEFISDFIDAHDPGSPFESIQQFTEYYGGTRASQADALGIDPRSLRRYLAYERGERGKEAARPPNLERLLRPVIGDVFQRVAAQIRRDGVRFRSVELNELCISDDCRPRSIGPNSLRPVTLPTLVEAIASGIEAGDYAEAGRALKQAFFIQAYPGIKGAVGRRPSEREVRKAMRVVDEAGADQSLTWDVADMHLELGR